MASSVREQILVYLTARLNEISGVTAQRSRQTPARRENGTVVVVLPIDEQATPELGASYERRLTVQISVRAWGAIPDQAADETAVAIYAKLMATDSTRRLGTLASQPIVELGRTFAMEDADLGAIDHQMLFAITYRTALSDEATAGS